MDRGFYFAVRTADACFIGGRTADERRDASRRGKQIAAKYAKTIKTYAMCTVVFAETDLRTAHMIVRRLSSVIRHTAHDRRDARSEPVVTLATLQPSDSANSLLARLYHQARRAAS